MYVFLCTFNKRLMQEFRQERNGLNKKPAGSFDLSVSSITWRKTGFNTSYDFYKYNYKSKEALQMGASLVVLRINYTRSSTVV